jgi:hypothetical protein
MVDPKRKKKEMMTDPQLMMSALVNARKNRALFSYAQFKEDSWKHAPHGSPAPREHLPVINSNKEGRILGTGLSKHFSFHFLCSRRQ